MNTEDRSMASPVRDSRSDASIPGLVRQLADDVTSIFTKEITLAKTEVYENVKEIKNGVVSAASGAFVLYAGVLTLLFAAVLGLGTIMDLWLSALIVGGAVTIIGFAMLGAGKKKMDAAALRPDRTIDSVKRTQHTTKGALS